MEKVALFLIIGQSNSTPIVGYMEEMEALLAGSWPALSARPAQPEPGTVYAGPSIAELTLENDVAELAARGLTGGYMPAFGKAWYTMTGEKAVFLQCALGATGMHEWTPNPHAYSCPCTHNGGGRLLSSAIESFKTSYAALSRKYEIVRCGYLWNQGEHDECFGKMPMAEINTAGKYYAAYRQMHELLMRTLPLQFGGMIVVRSHWSGETAQDSMALTIARAAQYALCQTIPELHMISRMPETCAKDMMSPAGIHYSQKTFNDMGAEAAWNLGKALSGALPEPEGVSLFGRSGALLARFGANGQLKEGTRVLTPGGGTDWVLARAEPIGADCRVTMEIRDGKLILQCAARKNTQPQADRYTDGFGRIDWEKLRSDGVDSLEILCR